MTQRIKTITLCADDYAQNIPISEGIIQLAEQQRINATSCMVNSNVWRETSPALLPIKSTTWVGLHFNLTHGNALSSSWRKNYGTTFPGMGRLLGLSYLRRLNVNVVIAELQAQIDAYTQSMNEYPDFIDGHQHIHQLPVIRDALLAVYANLPSGISIRKTSHNGMDLFKADGFPKRQLIALLGGLAFKKRLTAQSTPVNTSFSGIYNFKEAPNYRHYFQQFLKHSQDDGLIMCHPGHYSEDVSDPLYRYRHHELNYLMSDDYLNDLKSYSFQLKGKGSKNG